MAERPDTGAIYHDMQRLRFEVGHDSGPRLMSFLGQVELLLADNARLAGELAGAREAATEVQRLLDLSLPSEQTGPEWEKCVRVPVARLEAIDVVLARLGGET